jgi:DNA mismatch repair ATPase MutS
MLQQYFEIKRNIRSILCFSGWVLYEIFFEDANLGSKELT